MKKLFYILLTIIISKSVFSQSDKVFNYSDTIFSINSIHRLDLNYDYNGGRVIKDSLGTAELNELAKFLINNPNLYCHLENHTDHRGSDKYNLKLSEYRAQSVVFELITNYNIDSTKVKAIGFGESNPIVNMLFIEQMKLQNEDECIREGVYLVNRRTQLRIIDIKQH
ncbi:MAG: OmpA family protein [Flavobacteriales bacterium]|nr:OmpA family protein [Flavobacteriales bacterium]